jgi:hypothetical protein
MAATSIAPVFNFPFLITSNFSELMDARTESKK